MFTEEGRLTLIVFGLLATIFACGYFFGWTREALSIKIFDKMIYSMDKVKYWRARCEEVNSDYAALMGTYHELTLAVGIKHEGETRHQTALRYILEAEQGSLEASVDTKESP